MVQNIMEPIDVEVIKVTIKDKPGAAAQRQQQRRGEAAEAGLRVAFAALRQHARRQQDIREFGEAIEARGSQRRLRRCFDTWRDLATTARQLAEKKPSHERRIELLVNAIAEKQKEAAAAATGEKKKAADEAGAGGCAGRRHVAKSKSAPLVSKAKLGAESKLVKQRRAVSGGGKTESTVGQKNKLQSQRSIIEDQKVRLSEQRKIIEDMKLKEIDRETRNTTKQTINIAKQALSQCDQRTRRSLIYLIKEQGCRDKSIIDLPRVPSPPRFLIRMEERAEARKQRIKLAEETRQRRREEEKKREEIIRREAEEQQRQQQIQAWKEALKQRREQESRRLKEIEKNKRLEYTADQFYKKYLFRRYIVDPLSSLVEEKFERLKRADQHYGETLLFKVFGAWKSEWMDQQRAKAQLASRMYRHNLLWYAFDEWKTLALSLKQKYQVAVDFYDMKLQTRYIQAWHLLCVDVRAIENEKEAKAVKHYETHLKIVYFDTWRQYMTVADGIREREQRRDEWRDLIKKFIPDTPKFRNASLKC